MSLLYNAITSYVDLKINRERLVSWIDPEGTFESYINLLEDDIHAGNKKYKLIHFKGSFLETILSLHEVMQDTKKPDALVYIPYIAENEIVKTPFLEVLKSSIQITADPKELLDKVSSGYLSPDQLRKCKSSLPATYQHLDSILSGDDLDLSIFENPNSVKEFAKNLLSGNNTILDNIEKHPKGTLAQVQKGFEKTFGYIPFLTEYILDGRDLQYAKEKEDHSIYRLPLGAFLMGREYASDLLNCKPSSEKLVLLQEQGSTYLDSIKEILEYLRIQFPEAYKLLAIEIEELGIFDREKEDRKSKELGSIDTLFFEDTIHQLEALRLISIKKYKNARTLVKDRANSFWIKNEISVSQFWNWLDITSHLAIAIVESKQSFKEAKNLEDVLDRYASELYLIDREYRNFCQSTESLMQSTNRSYKEISFIRKEIWTEYSDWLISINDHYQFICEKQGFLPNQAQYQQRFYFQNFLKPLLDNGKTAVFFVDAMRYELGETLKTKLAESSFKASIAPIFAELPTITSVGMNALVPSEMQGALEPLIDKDKQSIKGFKTGNRNVSSVNDRKLILKEISKKNLEWISLEEIHRNYRDFESKAKSTDLLVIHSLEIDEAGENGFLSKGFDFFEDTISKIKISIERLRESGYENFSIVSDHGFIQYDTGSDQSRSSISIPANFLGSRRFVIQEDKITSAPYSRVEMNSLRYANAPYDVVFLKEPKIFKNSPSNKGFFHGGNSIQERIIPVITIKGESKTKAIPNMVSYEIHAVITIGRSKHVLELTLSSKNENVLFKENQILLVELDNIENARLRIITSNTPRYGSNEVELEPNKKYSLEFEILASNALIFQEKASIKIWNPSMKSTVDAWISDVKVPIRGNVSTDNSQMSSDAKTKKYKLPSNIEKDIEIILNELMDSAQGMITETGISRIFDDPRKSARAIRQFATFLQYRSNELEFSISIEHSGEGKIFKIGNK